MAITTSPFWDDPAKIYNPNITTTAGTPVTTGPTGNPNYAVNPAPTSGVGVFGAVPGPVGLPNPAGDLAAQYPNLPQTNQALSANILSQLSGQLSPGTLKMMQDAEAAQAIKSGMPGTNVQRGTLMGNRSVRDLGLTAEQQVQQGIANYNRTIPTVSGTQTVSPALESELAMWNAINRSAPDPAASGNYAQQLFNQYLQQMRQRSGGVSAAGAMTGLNIGAQEPTWQQTHPGLTPGFPDPTTTVPYTGGPDEYGYDPEYGWVGTPDYVDPGATDYGTEAAWIPSDLIDPYETYAVGG